MRMYGVQNGLYIDKLVKFLPVMNKELCFKTTGKVTFSKLLLLDAHLRNKMDEKINIVYCVGNFFKIASVGCIFTK